MNIGRSMNPIDDLQNFSGGIFPHIGQPVDGQEKGGVIGEQAGDGWGKIVVCFIKNIAQCDFWEGIYHESKIAAGIRRGVFSVQGFDDRRCRCFDFGQMGNKR